jgi:hypothetical protein
MLRRLLRTLTVPDQLFAEVEAEGYREPFLFLLAVSAVIAAFTALVNWLGWPSTDTSASLQAQILAWRVAEQWLLPRLGAWGFLAEAPLIVVLAALLAVLMAGLIHTVYRLVGGEGPLLHAWKAVCYGLAPCLLFGWVPYWSLFVGSWALVLQLYFAPKTLYRVREGRALLILAVIVASVLAEFAMRGTTVGFGPW